MTQEEFDNTVQSIAEYNVSIGNSVAIYSRQNDPCAYTLSEKLMALQNVLFALSDYDLTWGFLTDDEIEQYFELATQIAQSCP